MAATSKSQAHRCTPPQAYGVIIHAYKMIVSPRSTWHSLLQWAIG